MQEVHKQLKKSFHWYNSWHNHPRHQHFHWLVVFSAVLIFSFLIIVELFTLRLDESRLAQAQITPASTSPSGPNPCTQSEIDAGNQLGVAIMCDFSPSLVNPGDTVQISGVNLSSSINLYSSNGAIINVTGSTNSANTVTTFTIPSTIQEGDYTIGVIGTNLLDEARITKILSITTLAVFYSGNDPIGPAQCDPADLALNISIICTMSPTSVFPGDTVTLIGNRLGSVVQLFSSTVNITINGQANSNGTQMTFIVPVDTPEGSYRVDNVGQTGTATTTQLLTVTLAPIILPNFQPPAPFNPPPAPLSPPQATDFQDIITNILNYAVYIVGIAVFIMIMWGGFLWMTSAANPGNITTAKKIISNAILGAILLISSYVILYTINPEFTSSTFNLQGLGGGSSTSVPGPTGASVKLLAFNEPQSGIAITNGCLVTRELEDFTAVECPSSIAGQMGLLPNPQVSTQDINANQQVGADIVQANGNLGSGVTVAVIDTGYNYNHPELSSSYIGGWNFIADNNDPMDDDTRPTSLGGPGHGSHVAGIITADGIDPQAKGIAPDAQIVVAKFLDQNGDGDWDDLIAAIYWVVDNYSPDIINLSVGGGNFSNICDDNDQTTRNLAKALKYARDNGALPIVAAGNNISNVMIPGCISHAFTVSAVDSNDNFASFSGRGSMVDVSAPGVNIYSTLLGNNYGFKNGTSMATPVVSGIAALIKSLYPDYSVSKLEQAIINSTIDLGPSGKDNSFGSGRVTANAANPSGPPVVDPHILQQPPTSSPPSEEICTTSGTCGRIWPSLVSCVKGTTSPSNPNCNIILSYINNVSGSVNIRKNGANWRTVSAVSGTETDLNPSTGIYTYTLHIASTGVQIGTTTVYIYTAGTITSNFNSCSTNTLIGNPNCNVTLTINTYGVNPVLIGKDGVVNWQSATCNSTGNCTTTITDTAPALGIRTYTIHDGTNNARLARTTVNISQGVPSGGGGGSPPPGLVILCPQINFGGTCSGFFIPNVADLDTTVIGANNTVSIRVGIPNVTLCSNINWQGTCETFTNGDYPDLSSSTIGSGTASSIQQ